MLKGVHLTLLMGPGIPIPVPDIVINSVASIQVTNSKERNGFQISFNVDKKSELLRTMLPAGYFDPISTRVMIIATLNGFPNLLMDGFITTQEMSPSSEPGKSTLTITGEDVSTVMDIVEIIVPFPAMPDVAKIYFLLAQFAFLGLTPIVIPPPVPTIKVPADGWDGLFGKTHRAFLKQLASDCGYLFYIIPGPLPGQNIAYFGPDIDFNLPIPQPALSINMDANTNVESLSFSLNGLAKKIRVFTIFDPVTKKIPIPIPLPNVNIFKPPMGSRITPPSKLEFAHSGAKLPLDQAAKEILGFLMDPANSLAVSGNGSLDVVRYNNLLRPRMLVGVRGAGITYDGLYYVDSVTHNIKPGEFKQNFTLSRDGLVSNTPMLPV
jgi:hypothetical protein